MKKLLKNKEFVEKIHEIYEALESLEKTAQEVNEKYNLNTNRFQLSNAFHRFNLPVAPPNGKPVKHYGVRDDFSTPHSRFAAEWLKYLIKDLTEAERYSIEWLTACYGIFSPLYDTMLLLLQEGRVFNLDKLPKGVNQADIEEGKELYTLLMNRWIYCV